MPPEASSFPDSGSNCTDTSRSMKGPAGAKITLYSFLVARCSKAFLPFEVPGMSSTAHCPCTTVQPSMPRPAKSNFCSGALLLAKAGLLVGLHATTHQCALAELAREKGVSLKVLSAARTQVISALIYPAVLVTLAVVVVSIISLLVAVAALLVHRAIGGCRPRQSLRDGWPSAFSCSGRSSSALAGRSTDWATAP